jgi:hypothetical protein
VPSSRPLVANASGVGRGSLVFIQIIARALYLVVLIIRADVSRFVQISCYSGRRAARAARRFDEVPCGADGAP